MHVKTVNDSVPGVRTFHCESDSKPGTWYTVKRIRRPPSVKGAVIRNRWMCSCPDFMNRKVLDNKHCKHIKRIREYIIFLGGVSFMPKGVQMDVPAITKEPKKPYAILRTPKKSTPDFSKLASALMTKKLCVHCGHHFTINAVNRAVCPKCKKR